jgi:hypothetical protein
MSDDLSAREVFKIAAAIGRGAFVVGGQGLNIWAERFSARAPDLDAYRPFTSKDIDYFGYEAAARQLVEKLGGAPAARLALPSMDDATFSTAVVVAEIDGRKIIIDFISHVLGVKHTRLENSTMELRVPFTFDGASHELTLLLIHPVHCLQSRTANVMDPALLRRDDVSIRQLKAAVVVLREYILDRVEAGDHKEAIWSVRELFSWLRGHEHARTVHVELGIDPLDVLRAISLSPKWDPRYRDKTLKPMICEIERRRASRRRASQQTE